MMPLTTDQRGFERFVGGKSGIVDIGAHEAWYSALPVIVKGRITTPSGRGIYLARIKLEDGGGFIFATQTNPFGYYQLPALLPGVTYAVTITHKRYKFISPQSFTADQDRVDLDFTGAF
jgi:hypothetical protein